MFRKKRKENVNEFEKLEGELENEVKVVENWVIERRKFFIKLGIVILLVLLLLFYTRFL